MQSPAAGDEPALGWRWWKRSEAWRSRQRPSDGGTIGHASHLHIMRIVRGRQSGWAKHTEESYVVAAHTDGV
ncbi:MAG: hypothetical protein ACN6OP_13960, partial [Pseudomonadales bacterium]